MSVVQPSSKPSRPAYRLARTRNGTLSLHSLDYDETCHVGLGPAAEAEALYVRQLRLTERMRATRSAFVIWDVGLGGAANALAVIRATREISRELRMISFDKTTEPLQFALRHANELGYLQGYETVAETLASQQRVEFKNEKQRVVWELVEADFPDRLRQGHLHDIPKPDAILFDPFSPTKNPAMWTQPLFVNLYAVIDSQRPCSLATYSRSTAVRTALLVAGFYVGVGEPSGEKEETTLAANARDLIDHPLDRHWLERARRSHGAEPLGEPHYRQSPMSARTWERLQDHPQFR